MPDGKSLIELKAYGRCGDIYRWLRDHYDQVLEDRVELERSWAVITEEIESAGVKGTRGGPPLIDSVRMTWKRVCRDVEAARKRKEERKAEREAKTARRQPAPAPPKKEMPALVPRIAGSDPAAKSNGFVGGAGGYEGLSIDEVVELLWEKERFAPWRDPDLLPEEAAHMKSQYAYSKRQSLFRNMGHDGRLTPAQRHELAMEFNPTYRKEFLADQERRKQRKES